MNQVTNGHRAPEVGHVRQVLPDVGVQRHPPLLDQHRDRQAGELLRHRGDVEHRQRCDRDAILEVSAAKAAPVDNGAVLHHDDGGPRRRGPVPREKQLIYLAGGRRGRGLDPFQSDRVAARRRLGVEAPNLEPVIARGLRDHRNGLESAASVGAVELGQHRAVRPVEGDDDVDAELLDGDEHELTGLEGHAVGVRPVRGHLPFDRLAELERPGWGLAPGDTRPTQERRCNQAGQSEPLIDGDVR